ncbi:hypothetical protein LG307_10640 [Sutcliffiella horikoshii]|uniref:hypothetical protein n=1 Tax=Sutcliffiella horikoshii TaxID=79883 RepID=UPI00384DDB7F
MKNFLYGVIVVLLFSSFPNFTNAEEIVDSAPSPVYSEPAFTEFQPIENKSHEEFTTFGLTFASGTVSCYVIGSDSFCPWTIQVGGDVIIRSDVQVIFEKHHGFLSGGWKHYKTRDQKYPVNIATSTIRGEVSERLAPGKYRVKLGGTFITRKNGVYAPVAHGWSYFEIK